MHLLVSELFPLMALRVEKPKHYSSLKNQRARVFMASLVYPSLDTLLLLYIQYVLPGSIVVT